MVRGLTGLVLGEDGARHELIASLASQCYLEGDPAHAVPGASLDTDVPRSDHPPQGEDLGVPSKLQACEHKINRRITKFQTSCITVFQNLEVYESVSCLQREMSAIAQSEESDTVEAC